MRKLALALFTVLGFAGTATASTITYQAIMSGPNEATPNASPGVGYALITIDDVLNTMTLDVTFSGLTGTTTASHIHCCTAVAGTGAAGVATTTPTFAGFPLGVTSGTYFQTLDLTAASSYNPAFVTAHGGVPGAEAFLLSGIASGQSYLNIHSSTFGGGEIRGFLTPVPEPATLTLFGFGLAAIARRRMRKS
jgi:hypothetical protein